QVLDPERHALQGARLPGGNPAVAFHRHGERLLRGLDDIRVEASRRLDRRDISAGEFARREGARRETVADLCDRQLPEIGHLAPPRHSTTLGTTKKLSCRSGALATIASGRSPSVTTSGRIFIFMAVTDVIGSTPITSTSFSCSTKPRIVLSSAFSASASSS